jgi:hypothetical protein
VVSSLPNSQLKFSIYLLLKTLMHASCPAHFLLLDMIIPIIFWDRANHKAFHNAISRASCYFILLVSKYSPQQRSQTPSVYGYVLPSMRETKFHTIRNICAFSSHTYPVEASKYENLQLVYFLDFLRLHSQIICE